MFNEINYSRAAFQSIGEEEKNIWVWSYREGICAPQGNNARARHVYTVYAVCCQLFARIPRRRTRAMTNRTDIYRQAAHTHTTTLKMWAEDARLCLTRHRSAAMFALCTDSWLLFAVVSSGVVFVYCATIFGMGKNMDILLHLRHSGGACHLKMGSLTWNARARRFRSR